MPNLNGVTYYKLRSGFQGDITKNCSLTASEVDHNFLFLRGYDVVDFAWDADAKELVLTRLNGEKLIIQGILNSIDASASSYDPNTGTLILNIEGNEFPVTGFPLSEDLDELERKITTVSGNLASVVEKVSINTEKIEALSGNVSEISVQLSERINAVEDYVGEVDVRVSANTDSITSAQTYINMLEVYPGVPTLPGVIGDVPDTLVYEVGVNTVPRLPDTAITLTNGKFDSKGSVEVLPDYRTNYNPNFDIYINGVRYSRNTDFPLSYDVPYGKTYMTYFPILTYSAPSNLPLTNFNRETSKTGATAEEGTAIWEDGTAVIENLTTVIVGRYPCYINVSNGNIIPDTPATKISVTKYLVEAEWHTLEINYPPNYKNDVKYEFYFPDVLEMKSVMLDSGGFGKMEVNEETYHIGPVDPINGVPYQRLKVDSVNNIETMSYCFKMKEK